MSTLRIKLSHKEERNSLIIYDCTGKASAENRSGWGHRTIELSWITAAQLEIYKPEEKSPVIINTFPDFPRTDDFGFEIPQIRLGMTGGLESGAYKVVLRVKGTRPDQSKFEIAGSNIFILTKKAECCVDKLTARTANIPTSVFMKDDKKKKAVELSNLLQDVFWAKEKGFIDAAQNTLKYINLQCECCNS